MEKYEHTKLHILNYVARMLHTYFSNVTVHYWKIYFFHLEIF